MSDRTYGIVLALVLLTIFFVPYTIRNVQLAHRMPAQQAETTITQTGEVSTVQEKSTSVKHKETTSAYKETKKATERVIKTTQQKKIATEAQSYDDEWRITCYTPYSDGGRWGYATATGVTSQHLKTCAVDPNVIPLGSTIQVTGENGKTVTLLAVDTGNEVKGRHIDIFYDSTEAEGYAWVEDFGEYVKEVVVL